MLQKIIQKKHDLIRKMDKYHEDSKIYSVFEYKNDIKEFEYINNKIETHIKEKLKTKNL